MKSIVQELEYFNQYLKDFFTHKKNVPKAAHFVLQCRGKQIRPKLLLLAANILGKVDKKTYRAAALVEILHTATLVHDDIIDNASYRRNQPSVHIAFNTKVAVLLGDYLFAQCLQIATVHQDYDLLTSLSSVVELMSQTEILQLDQKKWYSIHQEQYLDLIYHKTAALFAATLAMGAMTVQASSKEIAYMSQIGKNIGMAFQMQDDILDIKAISKDKSTGIDLTNKKMTLPFIHMLKQATPQEKSSIISLMEDNNTCNPQKLIQWLDQYKSVAYTQKMIQEYQKKSLILLQKYTPSVYIQDLMHIIEEIHP